MKTTSPQKITFGELRETGIRDLLIYCADYKCSHSIEMSGDRWPDHVRLSDIADRFICTACGKRGADVRGSFRTPRWGPMPEWQMHPKTRLHKCWFDDQRLSWGCLCQKSHFNYDTMGLRYPSMGWTLPI